jgi:hypothetical protein
MDDNKPKTEKKTICSLEFTRNDGDQFLTIKTVPEVEKLFKAEKKEKSEKYLDFEGNGLEFYSLSDKLQNYIDKYQSGNDGYYSRSRHVILHKYGTDLLTEGCYNLSVLRTVGLSDGIKVKVNDLVLDDNVQAWTKELAEFLKYLYHTFIEKTEIKATINLEI